MSQIYYWDNNVVTWLIDRYPLDKLHSLVDAQVDGGHLKICEHVFGEALLGPGKQWVQDRKDKCFVPVTTEILLVLRDVLVATPAFVDHGKPKGRDADQYLVATVLAHQKGYNNNLLSDPPVLVTNERCMRGSETRMRIPDACRELGLTCFDFHQWLQSLGFKIDMVPV